MIQYQLKLRTTHSQEKVLKEWLWILTGAWNTAVRRIKNDAKDGIYHSKFAFRNQVAEHSSRLGIPSHTLQGIFTIVHDSWNRCFKKIAKAPRLKSARRPLNSIPFPDPIRMPKANRIMLPLLGKLRFHKQKLPEGRIKCGRLVKRASGWYLCLFIDASRAAIKRLHTGRIGIDPGFSTLLTLSTGEKITHPRESELLEKRLGQAQRGHDKQLAARIHERLANQKKDRNHKLSLKLVQNFDHIYFSKDNVKGIAKRFGKLVASSSHSQLRQMLSYKSLAGGAEFVEVDSKFSTRTCNVCQSLTGPIGISGLSVRSWTCNECGNSHDRDINAAINTLNFGVGRTLERSAA